MPKTEILSVPQAEIAPPAHEVTLPMGQLVTQQEIIERGDHQLVDEPNRGFTIERGSESLRQPKSVNDVLRADEDFKAKDFAQKYVDGVIPVVRVGNAWDDHIRRGERGFIVSFPVQKTKYAAAVEEGRVAPGLFDQAGKATPLKPGTVGLDILVDDDTKRTAVETWYKKQTKYMTVEQVDDLDGVEQREALKEVTEAYELSEGGNSVRLINFSRTMMSEQQLREAVNAVRSMADKTSGELLEVLDTIAILPADHPSLKVSVKQADGTSIDLPRNGYQAPHLLAISERLLQPVEQRPARSEQSKQFYEKHRLPGEPVEGPDAPKYTVSEGRWGVTLAHELTHISIPDKMQRYAQVPGPAPTLYGRDKTVEHIAELGAAEYIGGKDALAVPQDQREALEALRREQRGSPNEGLTFNRPLGPHFIACKELDITKGPLPLRLRYVSRQLPVEVTYTLV